MEQFSLADSAMGRRTIATVAASSGLALVVLAVFIRLDGGIEPMALSMLRRSVDHAGAGWHGLHLLMDTATAIGAFPTLAIVLVGTAGFLLCVDRAKVAVWLVAASLVGMGIGEAAKLLIARPRPDVVVHWQVVSSWSLPSGHTTDGTIVYLLLAQLAIRIAPTVSARRFLLWFALLLVLMIGVSRIYLGVHWPSDVLAGWGFGAAWAMVAGRWMPATSSPSSRSGSATS